MNDTRTTVLVSFSVFGQDPPWLLASVFTPLRVCIGFWACQNDAGTTVFAYIIAGCLVRAPGNDSVAFSPLFLCGFSAIRRDTGTAVFVSFSLCASGSSGMTRFGVHSVL